MVGSCGTAALGERIFYRLKADASGRMIDGLNTNIEDRHVRTVAGKFAKRDS